MPPLIVMAVGPPLVDAIVSIAVMVVVALLPMTCMAAADAAQTSARREHRISKAPSNCCFDAAGYDNSDEDGSDDDEAEARFDDAAAASSAAPGGLRQRVAAAEHGAGHEAAQQVPRNAQEQL